MSYSVNLYLLKISSLISAVLLSITINPARAAFEFDTNIFSDLGETNIDLSHFSGPVNQYQGFYYADIYLNKENILQNQRIELVLHQQQSNLCFTTALLDNLPLKKELLKFTTTDNNLNCPILNLADSDITINFLGHKNKLDLNFPQKYINNVDTNWVPPNMRDHGISGLVFDYSLIASHDKRKNYGNIYRNNSLRSYGTAGINLGKIRLRADYQYYNSNYNDNYFEWDRIYAFTDIGRLNSKIYAGELNTKSNLFDTFRFKGISLFSDEQMKPAYLRGYAPEITGIANSNAIITLKQYGSIIRTIQVPSGPFAITDLPSGLSGIIDVEIEEDSGSIQLYQVNIAEVPFLTRKGDIRYSANAGKIESYSKNNKLGYFASLDGSIGLTDRISLIQGVMITTNREYQSFNLGVGLNLNVLGAISFDVTHAKNSINKTQSFHGERYRVNYSKRLLRHSTITLSGFHSTSNYTTIQNYMTLKESGVQQHNVSHEKNRLSIHLSQNIPSLNSSFSIGISKSSYWNQASNEYYNMSLHHSIPKGRFKGSSITFSYSRNKNSYNTNHENRFSLYVSIPLTENYRERIQYNSNYNDRTRQQSHELTYHHYKDNINYSIGTRAYRRPNYNESNEYGINAYFDSMSRYGRLYATAEYSNQNRRATLGFDSSLTLTQYGLATHPRIYNDAARLIIDSEVSGVQIKNSTAATNIFGLAGIHNTPSYYPLSYTINNSNLPSNVEIQNSVFKLAVSDGAIAYRSTSPITGDQAISQIRLENGDFPPFGTMIYINNNFDREIAMVSEEGLAYLTGIKKNTNYHLKWGNAQSCQFTINSTDQVSLNNITCL